MNKSFDKNMLTLISIILIVIVMLFIYLFYKSATSTESMKVDLYFVDSYANELVPEQQTIADGDNISVVQTLLDRLLKGPNQKNLSRAIPSGVDIIEAEIRGNTVNVNLSSAYLNIGPKEQLFLRASLIFTLTELNFVESVSFRVGGEPLLDVNGIALGATKRTDMVISSDDLSPEPSYSQEITLYFSDADSEHLVAEKRMIEVNPNQPIEQYIVTELIKGPASSELLPTVPRETSIRGVETKDNICYVDISSDFTTKLSSGSQSEGLAIYSIVNSLTDINYVKKVQFLIEGEKYQVADGHYDLSKPLEFLEY